MSIPVFGQYIGWGLKYMKYSQTNSVTFSYVDTVVLLVLMLLLLSFFVFFLFFLTLNPESICLHYCLELYDDIL